jgi:hypothetical protein
MIPFGADKNEIGPLADIHRCDGIKDVRGDYELPKASPVGLEREAIVAEAQEFARGERGR